MHDGKRKRIVNLLACTILDIAVVGVADAMREP